jgi:hypothetical protein
MTLQINNRKKVGLMGIFCLGIFTTFCSIIRLTQVKAILATGDQTGLVLWATVEMNVGVSCKLNPLCSATNNSQIILTCLPTLLPLIKYYHDKKATPGQGSYPLDTRGNNLSYPKGGRHKIGTTYDSRGWNDRDSIDNSSQKKILGLQSSLEDYASEDSPQHRKGRDPSEGIVATTEVEVQHSNITDADIEIEKLKKKGGIW